MKPLRAALAGLLALAACVERAAPSPADPAPAPHEAKVAPAPIAPPPVREAPKPVRRVTVKEASGAGEQATAGARLSLPQAFVLPDKGGLLTLDFEHGARVRVSGPARVLADLAEQDLLLCGAGTISVDLAPSAPTPQSGFALLTPGGMFTLVRGGRYALRVEADGSTHGFVVSGSVTLRAAASAADQAAVLLAPGESFSLVPGGELKRATRAPGTLAQAEAAALALRAPRKSRRVDVQQLDQLLQVTLAETRALAERQAAIMGEHRALARAHDGGAERLAELQRELAQQAEQLSRARARLRLALGQRAAAAQTSAQGGDDEASREARALLSP